MAHELQTLTYIVKDMTVVCEDCCLSPELVINNSHYRHKTKRDGKTMNMLTLRERVKICSNISGDIATPVGGL